MAARGFQVTNLTWEISCTHVVGANPRPTVFEHLRGAVAVRYERSLHSGCASFSENRHRPLAGNQWFIVSADEGLGSLADCLPYQFFWGRAQGRRNGPGVPQ